MRWATSRAAPLARTREDYELDFGSTPLRLSDLVPDYLPCFRKRMEPLGIQPVNILFGFRRRFATVYPDHFRGGSLYMLIRQRQWKNRRQWGSS